MAIYLVWWWYRGLNALLMRRWLIRNYHQIGGVDYVGTPQIADGALGQLIDCPCLNYKPCFLYEITRFDDGIRRGNPQYLRFIL